MRTITVKAWARVSLATGDISNATFTSKDQAERCLPICSPEKDYRILPVTITCEVPEDE